MDKLQKIGVLTYKFEDYEYQEHLYVDDYTNKIYRSTESEDSMAFSGVTPSNLQTDIREYFEETLTPLRMVEMPSGSNKEKYLTILHSDKLNEDLQCYLVIEEYQGQVGKSVYYSYEIQMKASGYNAK